MMNFNSNYERAAFYMVSQNRKHNMWVMVKQSLFSSSESKSLWFSHCRSLSCFHFCMCASATCILLTSKGHSCLSRVNIWFPTMHFVHWLTCVFTHNSAHFHGLAIIPILWISKMKLRISCIFHRDTFRK